MKRFFIVLLCVLLTGFAPAQPGTYIRYGAADGLSGNYIYDVVQDKEGFLWISSNTGVYRFDGTHFRQFHTKDGLPDNEVLEICIDKYGRVWFCCFNGRIGYYDKGRFFHPGNTPALAGIRLMNYSPRFYEGRNNINHVLGIGGNYAQLKVNADSILSCKVMPYKASVYWEDGMDSYYLMDSFIYKNGRRLFQLREGLGSGTVVARGNACYYLQSTGLFRFREGREQLLFTWKDKLDPWKLEVQSPGRFFITCNNGKVIALREQNGVVVSSRVFTDVYSPGRAWADKDGGIWITSLADGLYYYPGNKGNARATRFSPQWPGKVITDMEVCGTQLVTGFENGSVACFSKELRLDTVLHHSTNTAMMVKNVYYDSNLGKVIVSGGSILVWRAGDNNTFRPVKVASSLHPMICPMKDAEITATGKLYLNSIRYLLAVDIAAGRLLVDSLFTSLSRKYAICPDIAPGKVWYSDIDGLHWLYQGRPRLLSSSNPFFHQRITDIKMPGPNLLVLTTESEGVAIADTLGKVRQLIEPKALHWGAVSRTKMYGDELWLAGEAGIGMFRRKGDRYRPVLWVNKNNGLLSDNVLSFCRDKDFLYAVTAEGLQKLDIGSLTQQPDKPRLLIHSVQNKTQIWRNPTGTINLPGESKEIRLECSAIAFGNTAPVTFAYCFEGSDNFIETSGPFFSIPLGFEGHKKLYLRCRKGNSAWSEEKILLLQIPIPFFQRWPVSLALLLCALALILLISNYLAARLRKRQLNERDMKLQVVLLKLRALQGMMNPHFVFNALNSIQSYINEHDRYLANKYLSKFSKLMRGSLNSSQETRSVLAKELEYISNYLDLEQLRFDGRLSYTFDIGPGVNADTILVPVMLLQPLAENAVIHGVMAGKKPVMITISCTIDGGNLLVCVKDNGPGLNSTRTVEKTHKSLGLDMIRNRLQLLSEMQGKEYSFRLTDNPDGPGAAATLRLALEYLS
ncbi:sensor histidine kinase [Taibaiella koreensis]|uniref:sensor histidine kinase n=1 Tax=Taibaiella koreensis TaxID=1268548 RepID=UPI000E59B3EC|nr:histidine kinase [Taibaiella koreensis]